MKFKKLLSSFLSIAILLSMITAMPIAHAETFSETVVQTVFELDADDIKSGNVPAYVNVNSDILDSTNTSDANGVLSKTVIADTDFIQVDLDAAAKALSGIDTGLYTIEIVTNAVDSDSTTKNGTIMYANGKADKLILRNREGSDVTTNKNDWSGDQYKAATTITKAYYTIEDLKLSDGTATSHTAKYDTATETGTSLFSGVANGNDLTAWSNAPVKGLTIKAANGYRANIASLKITRKAIFTSESYLKQEQTVFEMNADTLKAGTTPAGVTLNTAILDSANSSSASGLVSTSVIADTDFLAIDLKKVAAALPGGDTGLYTIELVTNAIDSDSATKNGTLMYVNGTSDLMALRSREAVDYTILKNDWSGTEYKAVSSVTTSHYTMTDLNLSTGAAASHTAKYNESSYLFGEVAHDSTLSAWSGAPIKGITIKAANGYRANIKSLKITRIAYLENVKYTIGATSEDENKGTVAITGLTDGQVVNGNSVTLTATAKDGYIFKGWYKEGEDVPASTEKSWTFNATESVSYIAKFTSAQEITQTVFELDAAGIEAGNIPAGVTLNSSILNGNATTADALVSHVVTAETEFLKIDFAELSKSFSGEDAGIYTIEFVANLNDSDSTTKNGTLMYINGAADKFALRARESSDFCVMNNSWAQPAWNATTAEEAHYTITELNLSTGAATSHLAQRKSGTTFSNQYSSTATGEALNAANAPIKGLTFKAAKDYRANIKSLKITRKALVPSVTCTINATTENAERGSVAISGVSQEEATFGQVQSGNSVTLTATRNSGYLFKGWYKGDSDTPVSTDSVYTFTVEESANYTARFVESYVANKVVFELNGADLEAGRIPAGVILNSEILDEASTGNVLVSDVVAADTAFLTIDLAKVGINTGDIGGNIYTVELVTNVNDSDDSTKNGTIMNLKGTSDKPVFRAREASDICAMPNEWADLYWQANTGATATYIMKNLNATDGSAQAHYAKRDNVPQYSAYANGHTLEAGNASAENPISVLTLKAAKDRRANIVSLKIARQVEIPLERVNVEVTTENDAYGIVTDIGDTAIKYSEITLKAEAKEGYIFAGWYDGNTLVSEEETWTFQVLEGFSYTAKFRKVIEEWVEVYGMDIADILAGTTADGVVISNLDEENSSATSGLLSAESDASADFMTITFANLPTPETAENDLLTDVYRVDMKLNLLDSDDTTKNGALIYYNKVANANMIARVRETRDGTFYKDGSATIYGGSVGSQQIPSLAYNFKMDTETGLFNQYVKHGVGDYYLFTDTASRGDNIALPENPEKVIIRNADYNSGGVNENYRVNIKSLSVKRLVKVVDTGNAVPVFSKERVTVVANSGEIWNGSGEFTTDVEKIVIDFGSEIDSTQITQDSVYITCDDVKIYSVPSAELKDGVTLVTLTGMTFEDGKTYKIVASDIVNVRGASLQKEDEYVAIKAKSSYEGITISGATIGGNTIAAASDITANTEVTVNVAHTNIATEKDVYVLYVAYKDGTKADVKLAKVENIIGSGNKTATFTTGNVSDVEGIDFIIWEGWNSMKLFDSFGF